MWTAPSLWRVCSRRGNVNFNLNHQPWPEWIKLKHCLSLWCGQWLSLAKLNWTNCHWFYSFVDRRSSNQTNHLSNSVWNGRLGLMLGTLTIPIEFTCYRLFVVVWRLFLHSSALLECRRWSAENLEVQKECRTTKLKREGVQKECRKLRHSPSALQECRRVQKKHNINSKQRMCWILWCQAHIGWAHWIFQYHGHQDRAECLWPLCRAQPALPSIVLPGKEGEWEEED